MMMKFFILLILFCYSFGLEAQEIGENINIGESVSGYIIKSNGDTILGYIKVQTRVKNQIKVKFRSRKKGARHKTYKPKDILGYGYTITICINARGVNRWKHFLRKKSDQPCVRFGSTNVFMEVKATGKARLYSFYTRKKNEIEDIYEHHYFLEFEDGSRERKISPNDFDWAVPTFLEDCSQLRNLIESHGYAKIEEIVSIYNDCVNLKKPSGCYGDQDVIEQN